MIEGLKPYKKYKSAEMPWLGKLPERWGEKRAKFLYREVDERSETGAEELLSVSHKTGVTPRSQKNVTMFKAESYVGHKLCRPDDLAINTMWAWMGALGVSRDTGIISPAYGVYRPIAPGQVQSRFADALLRTPAYVNEYICRSTGIRSSRLRLYPESFLRIPIALPPPDEQAAIVKFIDYADRRIRRYIRAKQKLIKLLEEQKQAIIHQAVTRGLDPNVRLKPSGVEWLGDVPEHWEVVKLKQLITRIEQGWSPQCDAQPSETDEWGVLKVGCVNGDVFNELQNKKLPGNLEPRPGLEVRDGDILMSRANTRELLGLAASARVPRGKLLLCDKLFRFHPKGGLADGGYLVLAIRSRPSRAQIESQTNGASSSMQNIGQDVVRNLVLACPPPAEQRDIVERVGAATEGLRAAILRESTAVELVREYRTRLIADVVTGKLDVRVAAANLPDELDSDEPELDEADDMEESDDTEAEEADE